MKIEIVPAIIAEDYEQLGDEIHHVAKHAKIVQIDVTDGKFAPSKTWPYNNPHDEIWRDLVKQEIGLPEWEKLDFEIDLMVENQIEEAEKWISAGATRVIGHIEAFKEGDKEKFKNLREQFGVELWLSLNPSTSNSVLDEHLDYLDGIQFMGNDKIGFHGVALDEKVLEKIAELRTKTNALGKPDFPIGIDIGVNFETAPKLLEAGVTHFAVGSLILNDDNPGQIIRELKDILV